MVKMDVLDDTEEKDLRTAEEIKIETIELGVRSLQWIFGWMPRGQVNKIGELRDHWFPPKEGSDDEDDDVEMTDFNTNNSNNSLSKL